VRDSSLGKLVRLSEKEDRDAEDLAFDPTVKRLCDRDGCQNDGELRPVLLLQPGRDYTGKPMRVPLGIVVCPTHAERSPDRYMSDEMWQDIVGGFKARDLAPPHRSSTRLDFDPHPGSVVAASEGERSPERLAMEATVDYVAGDATVSNAPAGLTLEERRVEVRRLGLQQAVEKMRRVMPRGGFTVVDTTTDQEIDQGKFKCRVQSETVGGPGVIVPVARGKTD
jgi:hypothetical protein